jgi:hypothetical protein
VVPASYPDRRTGCASGGRWHPWRGTPLLDENTAPRVAEHARAGHPDDGILSLHQWHDGAFLHADDEAILDAAYRESMTLVTFDVSSIPSILKERGEQGRSRGGLVFVDERSIGQDDYGGLVRALMALGDRMGNMDFTDVVLFL